MKQKPEKKRDTNACYEYDHKEKKNFRKGERDGRREEEREGFVVGFARE